MAKGNRGGKRSAGASNNEIGYKLKPGEEAYARLAPTWLNKQGQILIVKNSNGQYVYTGNINSNVPKTDTNSYEYQSALRSNNVKANFKSDGSVEVVKGGLYQRKKTFKDVDSFQKDVTSKLDAKINYENNNINYIKSGVLPYSELQASNYKTIIQNNPGSQAMMLINKDLNKNLQAAQTRRDAAQDMKERLNNAVYNYKKK